MSDSPVSKKLKTEGDSNGQDSNGNHTQDLTAALQGFQQGALPLAEPQQLSPAVPLEEVPPSETEEPAATPPVLPAVPTPPVEQEAQNQGRVDPNQIIAQLKENLRQEEAKLAFLKKLKLTQAKLKEHQEKLAQKTPNQTKEASYTNNKTSLPPPPPLIKPENTRCNNSSPGKPFSVIVSNSQAIQPKPEPTSLQQALNTLTSGSSLTSSLANMHRGASTASSAPVQTTSRAAMAKILEEMILQQPSPRPKILQWPICPNINDIEYLHYTGLEFIVDRLKNPNMMKVSNPGADITCIVCGLDFSPEWEKTDSEDQFECYYCFTSKLRKQVREEHTERLKQGFIKVVQKEKEFEKQLQVDTLVQQQREEQLMQQKLQEQQRQQQHLLEARAAEPSAQQQRNLQLQLQQQTLEQLQRQQIANQLLQHLQKSRQQPGSGASVLNALLQEPNALLQQLQKRGQAQSLQNNSTSNASAEQEKTNDHQLREYLLDLIPRLPTQ